MVAHLTNKHQIYLQQEHMILQIFIDTDYLLNHIGLKLLQLLQDLVPLHEKQHFRKNAQRE